MWPEMSRRHATCRAMITDACRVPMKHSSGQERYHSGVPRVALPHTGARRVKYAARACISVSILQAASRKTEQSHRSLAKKTRKQQIANTEGSDRLNRKKLRKTKPSAESQATRRRLNQLQIYSNAFYSRNSSLLMEIDQPKNERKSKTSLSKH